MLSTTLTMAPILPALQMQVRFVEDGVVPDGDMIPWYDFSGRRARDTIRAMMPRTRAVLFPQDGSVQVYADTSLGPVEVGFSRRRVTTAAPHQLIVTMVFFGLLMTVIAFLYMRNQLRPITRLADAAQAFGRGRTVPYWPSGAVEVRAAGSAFLDMRARIERQIEQRTLLLSGVSHDLRTPLTRMKLGLAMLDEEDAAPLLRDVDEMQRLVDRAMELGYRHLPGDAVAYVVDDCGQLEVCLAAADATLGGEAEALSWTNDGAGRDVFVVLDSYEDGATVPAERLVVDLAVY